MNSEKRLKFHGFSSFRFELASLLLSQNGHPVPLRRNAALVLALLIEREGELVEYAELRRLVWPGRVVEWRTGLHQIIKEIRQATDEGPQHKGFVETVPRRGYVFRSRSPNLAEHRPLGMTKLAYACLGATAFPVLFALVCGLYLIV